MRLRRRQLAVQKSFCGTCRIIVNSMYVALMLFINRPVAPMGHKQIYFLRFVTDR
jgi:hypothetical protein